MGSKCNQLSLTEEKKMFGCIPRTWTVAISETINLGWIFEKKTKDGPEYSKISPKEDSTDSSVISEQRKKSIFEDKLKGIDVVCGKMKKKIYESEVRIVQYTKEAQVWNDIGQKDRARASIKQRMIVAKELLDCQRTLDSMECMKSTLESTYMNLEAGETYKKVSQDIKDQFGVNAIQEIQGAKEHIDDALREMEDLNVVVQAPLNMSNVISDIDIDEEFNDMFGHNTEKKPVGIDATGKLQHLKYPSTTNKLTLTEEEVDEAINDIYGLEKTKHDLSTVNISQTKIHAKVAEKVPIEIKSK